MFSVGLSCFLGSYETVHLCSVRFVCIPIRVNMKFIGVQFDGHHKQKNHFENDF